MKSYEDMLKEAVDRLPKNTESSERFEVPKPIVAIQGNQTFISNFEEICNKLTRDKAHVAKYLFKELATPGSIDNHRLILQGKVMPSLIEKKVEGYVKAFVECRECKRPDTHFEKVGRMIFVVCDGCGSRQASKL
ncbi:translation initiation factor IF-2 subunit beta [Candidatus Micrarchaeota archaeon RBG_16_49_10]|nr:MAG: translation initiation factor IF-2 subunit beta [Candidatus Micrarchaeota archaeon RBG_16_49_10]